MRPGQNKRMRGRPTNGRRGPNPLTRSYESNGPDVKIRGNAQHVAEKYLQLARDAHTGGDPVAAENYLQHAEHYFRLIAAAQAAQAIAQGGGVRPPGEAEIEDLEEDDDYNALSDRFASPAERAAFQQQPQNAFQGQQPSAPNAPQPFVERPAFDGQNDRGGFQPRQERQGNRYPDRGPRQDRQFGERGEGGYRDNRQNRDRPREFRPYREPAPQGQGQAPAPEVADPSALPSFITAPVRPVVESEAPPQPMVETAAEPQPTPVESADPAPALGEATQGEVRYPPRVRRRRLRSPYGFNAAQQTDQELPSPEPNPVSDEPPTNE